MVDAVLFDIDGTLVDTVDLHARAWQEAFAHFGRPLAFDVVRAQIGKGGDQLKPVFLTKPELDRFGDALEEYRSELYQGRYLPRAQAFGKVRELFLALRDRGVRLALASSAKGAELSHYKQLTRIEDLVEVETSSEDAAKSKPHPDIFLAALERLGLSPGPGVLVVGDTPYDVIAARRAGLGAIAVRCGGFSDLSLAQAGCLGLYDDPAALLADLDASLLVRGGARVALPREVQI